jgi:hypothetical protein
MSELSPVALFVFRRPAHARQTLEALQADPLAAQSDLTIYADAAKTPGQEAEVSAVRKLAHESWRFNSVRVVERKENYGLSRSITEGVAELCAERGSVIVVEDDITVAPGFLQFMNDGLDRYKHDDRVMQISGYMFPGVALARRQPVFLPVISCWGWATWSRAWVDYDPAAKGFALLRSDKSMRHRFNLDGAYDYYGMLQQQMSGKIDSWGVRWLLSVFMKDGLVLYPPETLIQNTGVDGSGTHGSGTTALQVGIEGREALPIEAMQYPSKIAIDEQAFAGVKQILRSTQPNLLRQLIWKLLK